MRAPSIPPGWSLTIVIALAGLALRLGWQLAVGFYASADYWETDVIARHMLEGRGYVYEFYGTQWRAFGLPLYAYVLALLHSLGGGPGEYTLIGLVQALLSASVALGAFALARHLLDARAGIVASSIVALHPGFVLYSAKVYEMNLEVPLALLLALAAVEIAHDRTSAGAIRFGAVSAVAALARPTLAVASWMLLLVQAAVARRRALLLAAMLLAIGMAPTMLRNLALGYQGPSTPATCVQLWVGNNPEAAGDAYGRDGRSVFDSMPETLRERVIGRTEEEQMRAFCDAAIAYMVADPLRSLAWWAEKFGYFWWFSPHAGRTYPVGWLDAYRVLYAVELAFVAVGAAAIWRRGDRAGVSVIALMVFAIAASQSFFYVEGRHRLLVEPLLASVAAAGIVTVLRALPRGSSRPLAAGASGR